MDTSMEYDIVLLHIKNLAFQDNVLFTAFAVNNHNCSKLCL